MPMARGVDWLRPRRAVACACIVDPAERPVLGGQLLAELFRLTPAEARIAGELLGGRDVGEISDRLAIARRTVRVHLSRILEKTDTRRQGDLIRLLMNLAPLRPEDPAD
jgi:DNA-binding CsgD family transcriptional regulator